MPPKKPIPRVLCQPWTESEQDQGRRPDGYSLHLSRGDRDDFVREDQAKQREAAERHPKGQPTSYSFPEGEPYVVLVDDDTYTAVRKSRFGIARPGRAPKPLEVTLDGKNGS